MATELTEVLLRGFRGLIFDLAKSSKSDQKKYK